jgi:hypothetical protein
MHGPGPTRLLHFKQVFSSANATSAVLSDAIMTRTAIRILPFSIAPKENRALPDAYLLGLYAPTRVSSGKQFADSLTRVKSRHSGFSRNDR